MTVCLYNLKIDKKYFDRDRKDINYKEYKAYRKLLKHDIKEDNYNIREFFDCFYCINEYFEFYLSNIFGHCDYLPETIDSNDYNFSKNPTPLEVDKFRSIKCLFNMHRYEVYRVLNKYNAKREIVGNVIVSRCKHCGKIKVVNIEL